MLLTIITFVLVLSVLVFVHELGHFITARLFGVRAEEFGLGFPPRLVGWYHNHKGRLCRVMGTESVENLEKQADEERRLRPGSTVYSLNILPIGGFVRIKGENGEGKHEPDSFGHQRIAKRIVILSAGVIMNVFLAWLLLSVGYMIGLPQSGMELGRGARVEQASVIVTEVLADSPAERAGLQAGDVVLAVAGSPVASDEELQMAVSARGGQETSLNVQRNGEELTLVAIPEVRDVPDRATIGIAIFSTGSVSYPFLNSFWEGAKTTAWIIKEIFRAFYSLVGQIFSGQDVSGQFAGPVGIANITGEAARQGFAYLLQFAALLSLNLAVLNILPFPALDGGRILFLLVEKALGRPVRQDIEALIHNAGFLLLIALVIFITYKDIANLL